jgi:DUF4097 and DUF4098 domain-containing protein YvlB
LARAVERVVQQTYAVRPDCLLVVDAYRGGIVIEESEDTAVRITVRMTSTLANEGQANQALDALKLEMKADGNQVSVQVRNPRESRLRFVWGDDEPVDLSLQISVPSHCNVDLTTGSGGIVVGALAGRMKARTEKGTIFFRQIDGSVTATSGLGDVVVSRCSGDVFLTSRRGNIRAGTIHGRSELKTANGDIDVLSAEGGLTASADAGDVTAGFPRLFSESAGIDTAGGNILVKLDPASNCAVKATSVWGRVESTLPIAADAGGSAKSKLIGRLNRGGPLLTLRASGGHVKIEPREETAE